MYVSVYMVMYLCMCLKAPQNFLKDREEQIKKSQALLVGMENIWHWRSPVSGVYFADSEAFSSKALYPKGNS